MGLSQNRGVYTKLGGFPLVSSPKKVIPKTGTLGKKTTHPKSDPKRIEHGARRRLALHGPGGLPGALQHRDAELHEAPGPGGRAHLGRQLGHHLRAEARFGPENSLGLWLVGCKTSLIDGLVG